MVVAMVGLAVALSGTGIAAVANVPNNSVTTAKIVNNAVTTPKIKNSAVNASKIASNAVVAAKIASNAVNSAKIANGSIQPDDLSAAAKTSGPTGPQGPSGPSGPAGSPGNNSLVAFANVNGTGAAPSIRSSGGQGTTSASVASCGTGCFDVTFTGSYPGATSKDRIASFATADTDDFDWASTSLNQSPEPTTSQIRIRVWTMSPTAPTPHVVNRDFAVQILVP